MDNEIKRDVPLTEYEADMIYTALMQYRKTCLRSAINCNSGYGSASSTEKAKQWRSKVDEAETLANYVQYKQSGI